MGKLKLDSECAVNGLDALEKYKATPSRFFLVLMDMNMPVSSAHSRTLDHSANYEV
jgi:CheY-like chemotaxis protein